MPKRRADSASAPRESRRARAAASALDPPTDRAAIALWCTLAALVAARAALAFVPGTWVWSLSLHRFLSPVTGWGLWSLAALALVPPLAGRVSPALVRWGDALTRHPAGTTIAWAVGAAALAWLAPDRVRFVGDFLLRQGTVEVVEQPGRLFPQALPLDVFLHYAVPLKVTAAHVMTANGVARLLGAIEVGLLAALATMFARALELRGGAAFACAAVVLFGGYLGMFTGFSKAFAEMCVLMAVAGVCAIGTLRTGRGLFTFGLAVAIGLTLHRSALGMFPALALVWGLWLARHGRGGAWRRPGVLAAAVPPLLALAIMAPRIAGTVMNTDTAVHFAPPDVQAQGGVLRALFAGTRPLDLVSLALMLSPVALAIPLIAPLLAPTLTRRAGRGSEALVLTALALPFVAVMVFIHPAQGLFRDWDDFAATGVALSLVAAWLVGETLREPRRFAWLAVAVTLGVAVPSLQWLIVHTDTVRGLARVRAFVTESPQRPAPQRGTTWDYLGIRSFRLDRFADAQEAFAHAAETSPSPRILQEWGLAATMAGDLHTAQRAYQHMLEKQPDNPLGWLGLVAVSMRLRDVPEAKRAALELRRLDPANREAQRALDEIARYQAQQSDSTSRAPRR
jgi:hypothetical protein